MRKSLKKYEENTVRFLKKHWHSAIKSPLELAEHKGDALPFSVTGHPEFAKIIFYVSEIFETLNSYSERNIPWEYMNEAFKANTNGQLCVYLSILTYSLFLHNNICNDKSMKYVQGYYWHKARKGNPIIEMMGEEHAGTHAWIIIKGAVVDISIKQEELFFDFGGYPIILGKVPDGLLLKGFVEPKKTVNKFVESFARNQNLTPQQWIELHNQRANELFNKQDMLS